MHKSLSQNTLACMQQHGEAARGRPPQPRRARTSTDSADGTESSARGERTAHLDTRRSSVGVACALDMANVDINITLVNADSASHELLIHVGKHRHQLSFHSQSRCFQGSLACPFGGRGPLGRPAAAGGSRPLPSKRTHQHKRAQHERLCTADRGAPSGSLQRRLRESWTPRREVERTRTYACAHDNREWRAASPRAGGRDHPRHAHLSRLGHD